MALYVSRTRDSIEYVFQQQANTDTFELQLKQEQDKCTEAQTKLSEIKVRHGFFPQLH